MTLFFLGTGFLLVIPVFQHGYFVAHDLLPHLNWSYLFANQVWSGEFYPRWLHEMNGGRGSPVFFFYGPVPFYFASLFKPLFTHAGNGWMLLGCGFSLALGLSGVTAYFWLQGFVRPRISFIGAVLYMTMPFHLPVEIFFRFGYAELWALTWIPLVLHQTRNAAKDEPLAVVKLAVCYSLLVMTHLPATLILSPFLLFFGLCVQPKRLGSAVRVAIGLVLGVALSAIYLLPAMMLQDWVQLEQMTLWHGHFSRNFLLTGEGGPSGDLGFRRYLHLITIYSGFMSLWGFLMVLWGKNKQQLKEVTFWSFLLVISFFMMFPVSFPIWSNLPILQKIQFPWRFNVLVVPGVTALVAIGMESSDRFKGFQKALVPIMIAVFLLAQILFTTGCLKERLTNEIGPQDKQIIDHGLQVREGVPEYLPRSVDKKMVAAVRGWSLQPIGSELRILSGMGGGALREITPRTLLLDVQAEETVELVVNQFYFPLWRARERTTGEELQITPSADSLLQLKIPPGNHQIELSLKKGFVERTGLVLSALALGVILFWCAIEKRLRKRFPFPK